MLNLSRFVFFIHVAFELFLIYLSLRSAFCVFEEGTSFCVIRQEMFEEHNRRVFSLVN